MAACLHNVLLPGGVPVESPGHFSLHRTLPTPQIFLSLVVVSLMLTLGFWLMAHEFKDKHHYLPTEHSRGLFMESFLTFWAFLILLSVMLPLAMFIM